MMEGKAGVNMEFRKKMSRAKSNSPMKRSFRRAVAWLLVFCMCMANMNSAVYAAEIATSSDALMAATPSDATATDSNASEILMPEETISGEELKEETIRVISAGYEFDFDSEIRLMKDAEGKNENYSDLFKGYRSFTLFGDNGNGGRLTGGSDKAYGYIIVRVEKEAYEAFEKEEGTVKATDSDATDSDAAERNYVLTGNEELVFLYVNADDGSVTFTLNIENLNADDIVVPSHTELYAETEEETEEAGPAEQPAEDANEAGSPGAGGGSGSGSGDSSSDSENDPTDEGASDEGQTEGGQTEGGNSGSADAGTDTETPAEKPEDGQTGGGSDSQQENNGSSDTDTENGNTDSGDDGNTGNSEDNGSDSGSGNDNHGNADSGNTGNTENSGNSDSGSGSESGKNEGGSSDKGDSSDKGGSDSGSSSDKGDSDSDSAKLSKSSLNLPMVMGPNPNAEFEEDEFGDMSFDEWQEMMEEEEEEAEEEEDYTDEVSVAYDSEDDGISYLNMTMLPAVGATVKKAQPKRVFKLFKSSRSDEAEAVVMAGVVRIGDLVEGMAGATKSIKHLGGDNYRLHLDIAGKGQALDIVLVIDNSNSMYDSDFKMEDLKEILIGSNGGWGSPITEGFVDQVFAKNPESRIAVVSYENTAKVECQWSSNKNTVETSISDISKQGSWGNGKGGTNYEDGLLVARDVLKTKDPTHLPYVVFLSDGDPTYADWPENTFGTKGDYSGSGQSADSKMEKTIWWESMVSKNTVGEETIFAAKAFREDPATAGTTIYSVGIGRGYEEKYLKAIAGNNDEFVFSGDNLKNTFDRIFESLKLEDVKIEDTLSKYVELPEGSLDKANVRVYKTDSSGRETDLRDSEYNLVYDSSTKKLTLDLSAAEQSGLLKEGYTYAVEFDIRVTQKAKNEFEVNGYPENSVGGQDTGSTSEGNPGFPSNDVAKVTWKKNSTGYTYPVPVVQVIETPKVQYNKKAIQSTDNKEIYDLILDVTGLKKTPDSSTTTTASTDIVFVLDQSASMRYKLDNGQKRETVVNNAMEYILSDKTGVFKYADAEKQNIKVKGYIFQGKTTHIRPENNGWYTSPDAAKSGLEINAPESAGTYPQNALQKAIDSFDDSKADLKYIIYLTDGDPSDESDSSGGLNVLKKAGVSGKNIKFYPISINDDPDDNWNGSTWEPKGTYMEQVAEAAKQGGMSCDGVYSGVTADEIKQVFKQITGSIVTEIEQLGSGMTNVVISDELSEYAEFVSKPLTEGAFTVTAEDGTPVAHTVAFNEAEKKFSISFTKPLEEGVTYQVKVQIKPTQAAMDYYAKNGTYPNTPDAGTGTHADKNELGFYSNTEATLSFSYNGVTYVGDNAFEYPHPVIQILPEGRFVVQKIVETIDDNQTPLADAKFIINLEKTDVDGSQGQKFSSVALKNHETSPVVKTEGEAHFKISEAVPMEYSLKGIKVFQKTADAGQQDITAERLANSILTVKPGDDLIVQLTNNLAHKGYFHSVDQVTNWTNGSPETPFTSDKSAAREAAESQPTADTGKRNKKVAEMEEEEGDPLV